MEIDMARSFLAAATLAATLAATSIGVRPVAAQEAFPTRPIRIVMSLPPGSALDVVTRVIGAQLTGRWGQQVIVENRPGAGGLIAAQAVAAAPSDGYTLLGGGSAIFTILPAQKERLPIDVNRAFIQVGMILAGAPMYLAVSPKLGVASFAEFVALAKSKPGEIMIGTNGAGTLPHFAGLALAKMGNIPVTIVPYNQGGTLAAIADIMGGRVHATIEAFSGLRGSLQSGDLKLIGVMSPERDPYFPSVPVVATTVPGFSAVGFMSLAAPAGTPAWIVRRLSEGLRDALETPDVKQRLKDLGVPATTTMTPAETTAFIENEEKLWWPIVKENEPK
jgi:tripartite-type tricarboxylate transporter receptor subunit TctC